MKYLKVEISNSRGFVDKSKVEEKESDNNLKEVIKEWIDEDELYYYLNWWDDYGRKLEDYDLNEMNCVVLEGEENCVVIGVEEDFEENLDIIEGSIRGYEKYDWKEVEEKFCLK